MPMRTWEPSEVPFAYLVFEREYTYTHVKYSDTSISLQTCFFFLFFFSPLNSQTI